MATELPMTIPEPADERTAVRAIRTTWSCGVIAIGFGSRAFRQGWLDLDHSTRASSELGRGALNILVRRHLPGSAPGRAMLTVLINGDDRDIVDIEARRQCVETGDSREPGTVSQAQWQAMR